MVSIRKCEAVLTAINDGDGTGVHTRLKYLNLQRFPPGLRVGTARRADYDLDEVLAFALWFSLSQASFPPATATALVTDFWPEFTRMFLAAAHEDRAPGIEVEGLGETMAVITGKALKAASKEAPDEAAGPARAWNIEGALPSDLQDRLAGGYSSSVVVDLAATRRALLTALETGERPVAADWIAEQTASIARREGWTVALDRRGHRDVVAVRSKERNPRGEKLGERDYFFTRAIEIVDALAADATRRFPRQRLRRLARYVMRPSPREDWKRWVEVEDSGVQFVRAMEALIDGAGLVEGGSPHTVLTGAANRIADGEPGVLAAKIRHTAERARFYEPAAG